jgi:hypothetical protein
MRFDRITDVTAYLRHVKRWTRAEKEAVIPGDFDLLHELAKRPPIHHRKITALILRRSRSDRLDGGSRERRKAPFRDLTSEHPHERQHDQGQHG